MNRKSIMKKPETRGGKKPVTSTKKMFSYRVEESEHEILKEIAIYLNQKKL